MFKSTITRYAAAAFVGAALTFCATNLYASTDEVYHPTYLVFNRVALPESSGQVWTCTTTFNDRITNVLSMYTEDLPDNICVTKVNLSERGLEQMPEELGDIGLQGIYPATDPNGQAIPFSVYLPSIRN